MSSEGKVITKKDTDYVEKMTVHSFDVFREVMSEQVRQYVKWGEQNHPSVDVMLHQQGRIYERMSEHYEVPTQQRAKFLCDKAAKDGDVTYSHIIIEELCEAINSVDDSERRIELIQLAACVVQWIQAIDRRNEKAQPTI